MSWSMTDMTTTPILTRDNMVFIAVVVVSMVAWAIIVTHITDSWWIEVALFLAAYTIIDRVRPKSGN